jgi:hypothetical protein
VDWGYTVTLQTYGPGRYSQSSVHDAYTPFCTYGSQNTFSAMCELYGGCAYPPWTSSAYIDNCSTHSCWARKLCPSGVLVPRRRFVNRRLLRADQPHGHHQLDGRYQLQLVSGRDAAEGLDYEYQQRGDIECHG